MLNNKKIEICEWVEGLFSCAYSREAMFPWRIHAIYVIDIACRTQYNYSFEIICKKGKFTLKIISEKAHKDGFGPKKNNNQEKTTNKNLGNDKEKALEIMIKEIMIRTAPERLLGTEKVEEVRSILEEALA